MSDEKCEHDWEGEFWGGEPGVIELHQCAEPEGHAGPHICQCRERQENDHPGVEEIVATHLRSLLPPDVGVYTDIPVDASTDSDKH